MSNMEDPHLVDSDSEDEVPIPPGEGNMDLYSGFPKATITDRPFGSKVDAQSSTSCNQESLFWQKVEEMHKAAAKAKEMERLASEEHAKRKGYHLNIMVAGEAGHGKTTFINNMFSSYNKGKDVKPHDGSSTSVETFIRDPAKLCSQVPIENPDTMERVHYTIQDTPGYGDDTDVEKSIRMIVDYVVRQNEEYSAMPRNYLDTRDLASREDQRVDVCLYFIADHRLKMIDIKFMQAIALTVPIIPVIAKADSMTTEETASFRRHIMGKCAEHNIRLFDFADETKANVGIPADLVVPPFAVVASNRFDEHSDCTYLKKLLFEGFDELRRATEKRYLEYRRDAAKREPDCPSEEERAALEELLRSLA